MTEIVAIDGADFDLIEMNRQLDRTKAQVFMGKGANFFGALMCYQNFIWTDDVQTAAVDGENFYWNPKFFLEMPPETRKTILMHELWHIARLDMLRRGTRNPRIWNYACDISINNNLKDEGYTWEGFSPWEDQKYASWATEDIYDDLVKDHTDLEDLETILTGMSGPDDMLEPTEEQKKKQVTIVTQTAHTARMVGGDMPGDVEKILKQFLAPIIPWEAVLWRFFQDMMESDFSWATRDRRYQDIYLPGEVEDDGRLDHLAYFFDVSCSVTDPQVVRFNSEVKHIKESLKPRKLSLIQFDTIIQDVKVFAEEDPFEELKVKGRGGTCLKQVRQWIIDHKPTAAIIFSDLYVEPMERLPEEIPIIWVAIGNTSAKVPFGQLIHIKA